MSIFKKKKKKITDWTLLHGVRGTWKITPARGSVYDDHCNYEIYYSPTADEIKLEMEGYKPKGHTLYSVIMKMVGMYNEVILTNGDFLAVKKQIDKKINNINKKD